MRNVHVYSALVLLLFLGLIGCDSMSMEEEPPPTLPGPTLEPMLSSIQSLVFNSGCTSSNCHDSNDPARDLDLTAGNSFGELVNVASVDIPEMLLVKPSDPDSSYLIWKLEGNPGIEGQRMPRGQNATPLSSTRINVIRQWISDGAEDN